jgi:hypothetical protein
MEGPPDLSIAATTGLIVLGLIGWGAGLRLTMHPLLGEIEHVVSKLGNSRPSVSKRFETLRRLRRSVLAVVQQNEGS